MYFLSYESSIEFHSSVQRALYDPKSNWERSAVEVSQRPFLRRLEEIDRGYLGVNIPLEVRSILAELNGETNGKRYWKSILGRDLRGAAAQPIGRAMVLADRDFGLFDELSWSLLGIALDQFGSGDRFRLKLGDSDEQFDWRKLKGVLRSYFLPGMGIVSTSGVTRHDLEFTLLSAGEVVQLGLEVERSGKGLGWYGRGLSMVKPRHIQLVRALNTVMDDYSRRLSWMERYQGAELRLNGYTENQAEQIKYTLNIFFSIRRELLELRSGVFFGDDPIQVTHGGFQSRVYFARCEDCGRVASVEVPTAIGKSSWNSPRMHRSTVIESKVNGNLSKFHRDSGCSGVRARSYRTGKLIELPTPEG